MSATLRQLRAFLIGIGSASFSQAASRNNISQPGFSSLIRQLETDLGVRLFDRTTRRVSPTEAGRELAEGLAPLLASLDGLLGRVHADAARQRGRVVLGVMPSIGANLLGDIFADAALHHPDIAIDVYEDQAEPLARAVVDGTVDFAIGDAQSTLEHDDLAFRLLLRDRMVLVLPDGAALPATGEARWHDVFRLPYIALAQSSVKRAIALHLAEAGLVVRPVAEVKFVSSAIGMVRAGVGFVILPELAITLADLSDLAIVPMDPPVFRRIGIVTHVGRSLSPAALALREIARRASRRFQASRSVSSDPPAGTAVATRDTGS